MKGAWETYAEQGGVEKRAGWSAEYAVNYMGASI